MARDHFDLDAVRKNWERATVPERGKLPAKFAEVSTPGDPFLRGRELLARIRARALLEFAAHEGALVPFLHRADDLLARMEEQSKSSPPVASTELRDEFLEVLVDLEDLFEVFAKIGF